MLASSGILVVEVLCYKLGYKVFKLEVSNYFGTSVFFRQFFATWWHKKGLVNPIEGFSRFEKTNSSYLEQKNLEVAKFK
jgi:hypothetical protein